MEKLAVIFDMDGVIVDNHEFHFKAWKILSEQYGFILDENFYMEKINGRTMKESLPYILGQEADHDTMIKIGEEKEALYRQIYLPYIKPVKGLKNFLEQLKKLNIPRCIATSAHEANVNFTMDQTGLRPYFQTIIDAGFIAHGKPNPEIYLKSAEALNKSPENCIVFEDAFSGIKAGKSAGMKVVALATSHQRFELEKVADSIIDNFEGLDIQKLATELNI